MACGGAAGGGSVCDRCESCDVRESMRDEKRCAKLNPNRSGAPSVVFTFFRAHTSSVLRVVKGPDAWVSPV
jgi:hypothetical protein